MIIRDMRTEDCAAAVAIHLRSFQGFFLSFLGPAFLSRLYSAILSDPSGIAFVAEHEGSIVGFVVGSTHPTKLYKHLLRSHLFGFARASLPAFFRKPAILPRLLRAFRMPEQALPADNCALLMSLAVDPEHHSAGIGKSLVLVFLDEAGKLGSNSVYLTTDALNNDAVNHFYQSLGFSLHRPFTTPEGRQMNEYLIRVVS